MAKAIGMISALQSLAFLEPEAEGSLKQPERYLSKSLWPGIWAEW